MNRAAALGLIGFGVGVLLGFAWASNAKSRIGEAVNVKLQSGDLIVTVDGEKVLRAGLPNLF